MRRVVLATLRPEAAVERQLRGEEQNGEEDRPGQGKQQRHAREGHEGADEQQAFEQAATRAVGHARMALATRSMPKAMRMAR